MSVNHILIGSSWVCSAFLDFFTVGVLHLFIVIPTVWLAGIEIVFVKNFDKGRDKVKN